MMVFTTDTVTVRKTNTASSQTLAVQLEALRMSTVATNLVVGVLLGFVRLLLVWFDSH